MTMLLGSCAQGTEGHQLQPNLETRLETRPGSQEQHPGASGTVTAGTWMINSP
jgi:hypothetical protein